MFTKNSSKIWTVVKFATIIVTGLIFGCATPSPKAKVIENTVENSTRYVKYLQVKKQSFSHVDIKYLAPDSVGSMYPEIKDNGPKRGPEMFIDKNLGLQVYVKTGYSYDIFFGTEAEYYEAKKQTTGRKTGPKRLKKVFGTRYFDRSVSADGTKDHEVHKTVGNKYHNYQLKEHRYGQRGDQFIVTNNTVDDPLKYDTLDHAIKRGLPAKLRFSDTFNPDEIFYLFVTIYDRKGSKYSEGCRPDLGDRVVSKEVIGLNFK